jgi:hypothetical protein
MSVACDSPDIVPYGADQTIYVVVDALAPLGSDGQERRVEVEDLDTVVEAFIAGRFRDPLRVLAFNTLEHWSQDLSSEVAKEILTRCDIEGVAAPEHLIDFLERHTAPSRAPVAL